MQAAGSDSGKQAHLKNGVFCHLWAGCQTEHGKVVSVIVRYSIHLLVSAAHGRVAVAKVGSQARG